MQRTTVNIGQIKIQGAATCLFLCMDACGLPYSSRDFSDECVFNEMLEQNHYNTYSSARHSGARRTLYLALDARGRPRRVQLPARRALGKLAGYARVLTRPARRPPRSCVPRANLAAPRRRCRHRRRPAPPGAPGAGPPARHKRPRKHPPGKPKDLDKKKQRPPKRRKAGRALEDATAPTTLPTTTPAAPPTAPSTLPPAPGSWESDEEWSTPEEEASTPSFAQFFRSAPAAQEPAEA